MLALRSVLSLHCTLFPAFAILSFIPPHISSHCALLRSDLPSYYCIAHAGRRRAGGALQPLLPSPSWRTLSVVYLRSPPVIASGVMPGAGGSVARRASLGLRAALRTLIALLVACHAGQVCGQSQRRCRAANRPLWPAERPHSRPHAAGCWWLRGKGTGQHLPAVPRANTLPERLPPLPPSPLPQVAAGRRAEVASVRQLRAALADDSISEVAVLPGGSWNFSREEWGAGAVRIHRAVLLEGVPSPDGRPPYGALAAAWACIPCMPCADACLCAGRPRAAGAARPACVPHGCCTCASSVCPRCNAPAARPSPACCPCRHSCSHRSGCEPAGGAGGGGRQRQPAPARPVRR